jgi:hypothetical protein
VLPNYDNVVIFRKLNRMEPQREFQLWRPGWKDAVRGFLLSEHFQGAMQLTMGILFVSLFVFVR